MNEDKRLQSFEGWEPGVITVRWMAAVIVLLLAACVALAGEEKAAGPFDGLPALLEQMRQDFEVPGVAVVVVGLTPEPAIFTSGQRAVDDPTPITADTMFHIASVTKCFNATLAATFVDEGRLAWDTKVKDVIQEFEVADPVTTARATLRDLLSHRTGYGRHVAPSINLDASPEWWLPRLKLLRPAEGFRDRARYSGTMAGVGGLMLARAGRAPWPELLRRRLLEPLGMNRTTDDPGAVGAADLAVGHVEMDGIPVPAEPVSWSVDVAQTGLYSTAHDMGRWLQLLIHEGTIDGRQVVTASRLHETWTPNAVLRQEGNAGSAGIRAYGLGWEIWSRFDCRWLSHAGGGAGYTAQLTFLPDRGVGVAVLSNRSVNPIPDLVISKLLYGFLGQPFDYPRDQVLAMVARMLAMRRDAKASLLEERIEGAVPPVPLESYAGEYSDRLYGSVDVDVDDQTLSLSFHDIPFEVTHLHDHVFALWSPIFDGLRARFEVAPDAGVTALHLALDGGEVEFVRSEQALPEIAASSRLHAAPPAGADVLASLTAISVFMDPM